MNNILPNSIQQPHIIAFDMLMKQRLSKLELDQLLFYLIDTVNSNALLSLATQFDLLGYNGWKLADTDDKKRALIKSGIELHRFKGTVWAIKQALKTVGFPDVTITEHVSHWAGFTIQLNIGDNPIDVDSINEALAMVNAYKNVRSHLMGFEFAISFGDTFQITDETFDATGDQFGDSLFLGSDFLYDGTYNYNGDKNYNADSDTLELTIN